MNIPDDLDVMGEREDIEAFTVTAASPGTIAPGAASVGTVNKQFGLGPRFPPRVEGVTFGGATKWKCYMFSSWRPGNMRYVWTYDTPPPWHIRRFMEWFLDCRWEKINEVS